MTRREVLALAGSVPVLFQTTSPAAGPQEKTAFGSTPDRLVPFRWPSSWTDPKLIALFQGGPVNCLLIEGASPAPVIEAARKVGLVVLEWSALAAAPLAAAGWDSAAPVIAITEVVWPRLRPLTRGGRNPADAVAGPTGAPWIDSNSWVARLAAARAPGKQIWLGFAPPQGASPSEGEYRLAIADSAANGAHWMIRLDERLCAGLAAGNSDAVRTWHGMLDAVSLFEKRNAWRSYVRQGPLGVVSTFSGANQFLGAEFLNLAARRNLLYRVLDPARGDSADLRGLRAVIYLDAEKPDAPWTARLAAFTRAGGLLIASRAAASAFAGEGVLDCPVAGYELRRFGKGTLAVPARDWDDPYWVAADAHDLVSRRYDPVRLFNASSMWVHYSAPPRGTGGLVQLVNFTGRPAGTVSIGIAGPHRSVAMYTLESADPAPLPQSRVDNRVEYHLPAFSIYAALEVTA